MSEAGTGGESPLEANRRLWDHLAEIHPETDFYDVEGFLAGQSSLHEPELELLGSVDGQRVLHLQCHFGLDTLSLARLGARVVGVDFSAPALERARDLAAETGLTADFVQSDVLTLPDILESDAGGFDIVFTSYGVLPWLADLSRWAEVVRHFLVPGGRLVLVEFHPVAYMIHDAAGTTVTQPYFGGGDPDVFPWNGSYADLEADVDAEAWEWTHTVADTLTAILGAGLRLRAFREYPWSPYGCFPFVREVAPHRWVHREGEGRLPLLFGVDAVKEV